MKGNYSSYDCLRLHMDDDGMLTLINSILCTLFFGFFLIFKRIFLLTQWRTYIFLISKSYTDFAFIQFCQNQKWHLLGTLNILENQSILPTH